MSVPKASTEAIGRAGEFFTAYCFETRGIRTVHVDVWGHDLWAQTPSGRLLTIQVKTAGGLYGANDRTRRSPRYRFSRKSNSPDADLYVFVALELSCLLVSDSMEREKRIPAKEFTPAAMNASIARLLY